MVTTAREMILKAPQKYESIEVFGGIFTIRAITGKERDVIFAANGPQRSNCLIAAVLGDETGRRVFDDSDKDMEILSGLDSRDLMKVLKAGIKFNHLDGDDTEKKS